MEKSKVEPIIVVENLNKTFIVPTEKRNTLKDTLFNLHRRNPKRVFKALQDINFSVKKGEFFGIIGRNGSGKSTLLKILARIYRSDRGSKLNIGGTISPFLELGVGFNPEMTARENVYLNAAILGVPTKVIDDRFDDIIAFAELGDFVDQKLKFFSSGMQVRLAFAVAIQVDADILLLDEVLAVGDADFQRKCFDTFRQFKKQGKTIIFVSHDLSSVRQFCNRVLYLKDSKIEMIGDPNEVIDYYLYSDKEELGNTEKVDAKKTQKTKLPDVDILNVRFVDKFGHENRTFMSGDPMTMEVVVKSKIKIVKPNLGFIFYDDKDNYIFGSNNDIKGEILPDIIPGKTTISIVIPNIVLLQGKFLVTVAIGDMLYTKNYVWKDRAFAFYVNPSSRTLGIVDQPYQLK